MEPFLKIIDSLAWPITILLLVFVFRSELRKILARLSSIKYKEFEANFNQHLRAAEEQIHLLGTSDKNIQRLETETIKQDLSFENIRHTLDSLKDTLKRVSEISPRAAIAEAWTNLELHSKRAAEDMGMNGSDRSITLNVLREFIPIRYNEGIIDLFNNLRVMRNQALHSFEFALSTEEAERYIEIAIELIGMIRLGGEMEKNAKSRKRVANKANSADAKSRAAD